MFSPIFFVFDSHAGFIPRGLLRCMSIVQYREFPESRSREAKHGLWGQVTGADVEARHADASGGELGRGELGTEEDHKVLMTISMEQKYVMLKI